MKTHVLWKFTFLLGLLLLNTTLAMRLIEYFELDTEVPPPNHTLISPAHAESEPVRYVPPRFEKLQPLGAEVSETLSSGSTPLQVGIEKKALHLVYSDAEARLLSRLYMHFEHDSTALSLELAEALEKLMGQIDLSGLNSIRIAAPMPPNAQEIQRQAIRLRTRALAEAIYPYLQSISIVYPQTEDDADRLVLEFNKPVQVRITHNTAS
ncbi:MAG: hypothetical protein AAF512_01155 [Pseudomonadota bacterium]